MRPSEEHRGGTVNRFGFSADELRKLHNPKNLATFVSFGGLGGLEKGLKTDRFHGLSGHEATGSHAALETQQWEHPAVFRVGTNLELQSRPEILFHERRQVFGDNQLPTTPVPSFPQLLWRSYDDPILFLLTAAAVVSLAVGFYQSFGTARSPNTPAVEWVEGVAILVAIVVIVLVGAINDWEKQRQFQKLDKKQLSKEVKVVRSGVPRLIPTAEVLVGDLVQIEPGDVVPADGILVTGYQVSCDESISTGESEPVLKTSGEEAYQIGCAESSARESDPFLLSGTKVTEGIGTFLVTVTGINSTQGRILASVSDESKLTPLQARLSTLAKYISRLGGLFALLLFVALFLRFLVGLRHNTQTPTATGQTFIGIVIITLTVLVIAVPEGLPIVVTLSLAHAITKMLKEHNLVRHLQACETMGNATSICSDKTGTLTEGQMVVVSALVGTSLQFENMSWSSSPKLELNPTARSTDQPSHESKMLLAQSIALNTTAFEEPENGSFVGTNTETALLNFARTQFEMGPLAMERSKAKVTQLIPFTGARQCMATVIKLPGESLGYRVFIKGASEVVLATCTKISCEPTRNYTMSEQERGMLVKTIRTYAEQSLRTLTIGYKDIYPASDQDEPLYLSLDYLLQDLVFMLLVGIKDSVRAGVPEAVRACQDAGITVRMVTGDNVQTATVIAKQCGILSLSNEDVVIEGAEFGRLSNAEIDVLIPRLRVIARSSPEDKRTLVDRLHSRGEIVAVTGDGINDVPSMSAADVSFSIGGLSGTEVAREASSMILLRNDFMSIVKAIMWGRAINDSVKRFLQFQITITFTSLVLAFASAITNPTEGSVLTPVQLMWVNLIQDTLASLALATDSPTAAILNRKPEQRDAPLVTIKMWKTILVQSIWQVVVTLTLYFAGDSLLSSLNGEDDQQLKTLIFNVYVWLQVFNMFNDRQCDDTINVFQGIHRNWLFILVSTIIVGGQILIVFIGGAAFSVVRLTGPQWALSIVLGMLSLPIGALTRLMPDWPLEKCGSFCQELYTLARKLRRTDVGSAEESSS